MGAAVGDEGMPMGGHAGGFAGAEVKQGAAGCNAGRHSNAGLAAGCNVPGLQSRWDRRSTGATTPWMSCPLQPLLLLIGLSSSWKSLASCAAGLPRGGSVLAASAHMDSTPSWPCCSIARCVLKKWHCAAAASSVSICDMRLQSQAAVVLPRGQVAITHPMVPLLPAQAHSRVTSCFSAATAAGSAALERPAA
ncbi:hypothetical protein ABPG75_002684 [Micractinium tetrahymenae]